MAYHELEPGDEDVLEECPVCRNGYMVPHQEIGINAANVVLRLKKMNMAY